MRSARRQLQHVHWVLSLVLVNTEGNNGQKMPADVQTVQVSRGGTGTDWGKFRALQLAHRDTDDRLEQCKVHRSECNKRWNILCMIQYRVYSKQYSAL